MTTLTSLSSSDRLEASFSARTIKIYRGQGKISSLIRFGLDLFRKVNRFLYNMTPTTEEIDKRTTSEYVLVNVLGDCTFSAVYLANNVGTNNEFRRRTTSLGERRKCILGHTCSYFVKSYRTFQDNKRLYFVLIYAKNGELLK